MFHRLCALLIVMAITAPCRAQNTFVVEIKVELTNGTAVSEAEVTAYRNGKKLAEQPRETHPGGHYRFDNLPVGDPVFFKTEYHRAPGMPQVKFVPHIVRSLSGRKQQNDGQIPVVLMTTDEAKSAMVLGSAIGQVEDAYRLMAGTPDFAERAKPYQKLLDELAHAWTQDDVKKAFEEDADGYKLLGGKLNALASQFQKELPVVSTKSLSFPVVVHFTPTSDLGAALPYDNTFTIVDNLNNKRWWKPYNEAFQMLEVAGFDPSAKRYGYTAEISRKGEPYVFMVQDGKIQSSTGARQLTTIDKAGLAKRIFVAPGGNIVAAWEPQGSVTFYTQNDEQWTKAANTTVGAPVENWAFSPDGKKFAYTSGTFFDGRVNVYDIENRRWLHTLKFLDGASGVTFDGDGAGIYVSSRLKDVIRKYDITTGRPEADQHTVPGLFGPLGWDAEKKMIRVPTISGEIMSLQADGIQ